MLHGCDAPIHSFRTALSGARLHHAWLLGGPRGVGKATFADRAARLLLDAEAGDTQGAGLIAAGSHPDFRRIERGMNEKTGTLRRNITVDQVRALRPMLATATSLGKRRVILIDTIDEMEREAANALLKMLEEPPLSTVFLLVSHQPGRLLPTIRSRCRSLKFLPLDDAAMTSVLSEHLPELDADARAALIAMSGGSPGAALANAELDIATLDGALGALAETGDLTNAIRSELARSLSLKAAQPRYEAFLERAPAYIAQRARAMRGEALERAITAWEKARALAQVALPRSLVAETVVFELAGLVASLAPAETRAKA